MKLPSSSVDEVPLTNGDEVGDDFRQPHPILAESWQRFFARLGPSRIGIQDRALRDAWEFLLKRKRDDVLVEARGDVVSLVPRSVVVRALMPNCRFILATIRNILAAEGVDILLMIHPIFHIQRDKDGFLQQIAPPVEYEDPSLEGAGNESFVHIEIPPQPQDRLDTIVSSLAYNIDLVRAANHDFRSMDARLSEIIDLLDSPEGIHPAFTGLEGMAHKANIVHYLEWLKEESFVFLGYRKYKLFAEGGKRYLTIDPKSGLGVLRDPSHLRKPVDIESLPEYYRRRVLSNRPLILDRTNTETLIHRHGPMDYIGIRLFDESGTLVCEHRFLGLFSQRALQAQARFQQALQLRLRRLLRQAKVIPKSHDYRNICSIFDCLPKEDLFLSRDEELYTRIHEILTAYQEKRLSVFSQPSHSGRVTSLLMTCPIDFYSVDSLERVYAYLSEVFNPRSISINETRPHRDFLLIQYKIVRRDDDDQSVDAETMGRTIANMLYPWSNRLRKLIEESHPPDERGALIHNYAHAFPAKYQSAHTPKDAFDNIVFLEALREEARDQITFVHDETLASSSEKGSTIEHIRVYSRRKLSLSEVVPRFASFGFEVLNESCDVIEGPSFCSYIHTYSVAPPRQGYEHANESGGNILIRALRDIFWGNGVSDQLNMLIPICGITTEEVAIFRCYYSYYFQIGGRFTRKTTRDALLSSPALVKLLLQYFRLRFDPSISSHESRVKSLDTVEAQIEEAFSSISGDVQYDILRAFLSLIKATVRTNYFSISLNRENPEREAIPSSLSSSSSKSKSQKTLPSPALAIKIQSGLVHDIPDPKPMFEIYVQGPSVEGIHLRGGRVARGGIRWSDRVDDFRSEVLGLMKTQMTKNTLIVPVGAKGGFITRQGETGEGAYRTFITSLLSVTDNIVNDSVVTPKDIVRWDDPDPYLVVAADKGTARFSDFANEISLGCDFWLGDAFASGGSNGYDHKKQGITARGAFVCLERHFYERGIRFDEATWTCIGIGDMSGDVFGNGFLLGKNIKLLGAFNHAEIFIDPDPDPARSWNERERLFSLPSSKWSDYAMDAISAGGGVYPRQARSIILSSQARKVLGLSGNGEKKMSGDDVVRALLKAPVDVLYNGGVGTFVKSEDETHASCSDKANDNLRIDACELRCSIISEGGNLGLTQLARVDFAMRDGHVNTDFVDNSAGVDMSDHEVNIKILLDSLVRKGLLSADERNHMLREVEDEVIKLVLEDNRLQTLSLSVDKIRASEGMDRFIDLMDNLEGEGVLDRPGEFLPDPKDLIVQRAAGRGWEIPQLAILMSHEKMRIYDMLMTSEIPNQPFCEKELFLYFPDGISRRFQSEIRSHPLRKEIISSMITNRIVNSSGASFMYEVSRDCGYSYEEIAQAYLLVEAVLGIEEIRQHVRSMEGDVPYKVVYKKWRRTERVVKMCVMWLLRQSVLRPLTDELVNQSKAQLSEYMEGLRALERHGDDSDWLERMRLRDKSLNIPDAVSEATMGLEQLQHFFVIQGLMEATGSSAQHCAQTFLEVGSQFSIEGLRGLINDVPVADLWDLATQLRTHEEITDAHYLLARRVLERQAGDLKSFLASSGDADRHYHKLLRLSRAETLRNFHSFFVIIGSLKRIAHRASRDR